MARDQRNTWCMKKWVFPGCAVPAVILNLGSRMVACRSHQALPHGGAHRLAEAKATSLREHWFKEYMADSNTPGNINCTPGRFTRRCDAIALRQNNFS